MPIVRPLYDLNLLASGQGMSQIQQRASQEYVRRQTLDPTLRIQPAATAATASAALTLARPLTNQGNDRESQGTGHI